MESTQITPLDISQPLRRRDNGQFEIWKVADGKIYGRILTKHGEWVAYDWPANGSHYQEQVHSYDLLPAPRRIKGWINIYHELNYGGIHATREMADLSDRTFTKVRIACIYIDAAEGDGLDDQIDKRWSPGFSSLNNPINL